MAAALVVVVLLLVNDRLSSGYSSSQSVLEMLLAVL
jgi:hypothetical protein